MGLAEIIAFPESWLQVGGADIGVALALASDAQAVERGAIARNALLVALVPERLVGGDTCLGAGLDVAGEAVLWLVAGRAVLFTNHAPVGDGAFLFRHGLARGKHKAGEKNQYRIQIHDHPPDNKQTPHD